MYIRNLIQPGQYVMPVPHGLLITARYNEKGILDQVTLSNQEVMSVAEFHALYSSKVIPVKINLTGGAQWVFGVLYCGKVFPCDGSHDLEYQKAVLNYFVKNPKEFNFFAGYMKSNSVMIVGAQQNRRWLASNGFNVLNGWLAPAEVSKQSIENTIQFAGRFPYIYPLVSGYIIFDRSGCQFNSTNLSFHSVEDAKKFADQYGHIKYEMHCPNNVLLISDYSDAVTYDIVPNTNVVCDNYGSIIYSYNHTSKLHLSGTISCQYCGKQIVLPKTGECMCSNTHCLSRMYPVIEHFLAHYDIPMISYEEYESRISHGDITCLTDIFYLDAYHDLKIRTSLTDLLIAMIPVNVIANTQVISSFTQHCNNNVNTFSYYAEHPEDILKDFHLSGRDISALIKWLQDDENLLMLNTLLDMKENIIISQDKKFDGDPIFRGKKDLYYRRFHPRES